MRLIRVILASVFVVLAMSAASAQTGGLTIQVVDSNGPLPGATVTISHETGFVKTTAVLTDKDGIAAFPVLRPGKGYEIEVQFPGFGMRRVPDIRVEINRNKPITVQLAEELQERVKVIAEGEVVDLENTSQTTKFSDEFIQDLPVPGRFYQNVLTLAPGVEDADGDGNPNVHGSRDRDFKAIVSGISNVDPLTGQFMSRVNPNSIEEMEVITAGAGVEFSRAQGGFARIIQKQGSNDFEGVFDFLWSSSKLNGDGAADFDNTSEPSFDSYQPGIQVSGPIVKDRLWFRLSHELIDLQNPINVTSGIEVETTTQTINSDQITWQVSPRNKLSFQFQSDPLEIDNAGVSSARPAEAALRYERGGDTYSLTWTAPFSPKVLVESKVAWQDLQSGIFPSTTGIKNDCVASVEGLGFLSESQCFNADTGTWTGSYFRTLDDHAQRFTVRTDATMFGGRFWGMSHTFKLGFFSENERYFRFLQELPSLRVFFYDASQDAQDNPDATPELQALIVSDVSVPQTSNVRANGNTWGIYAEDAIKPMNNMTITLGMRVEREEINSNGLTPFAPDVESENYVDLITGIYAGLDREAVAQQETFTAFEALADFSRELSQILGIDQDSIEGRYSHATSQSTFWHQTRRLGNIAVGNTNFSPSLSFAWDPWSNNKTKFALTARRYYDKLFLNIPLIELNPAGAFIVFNAVPNAGTGQFVPTGLRQSIDAAVNVSTVDRNLKTPYQDEITLSVERELWAETSVKLTYIERAYRNQLQDVDINRKPGDFGKCRIATLNDNRTLEPSPGAGFELIDPFTGETYIDTEPGDGDGYGRHGFDDCAGRIIVPENQPPGNDIFSADTRLERPDDIPDLYIQNPGWGNIYLVGNINRIDYKAYVLELVRRQYRSWELQGSYRWSEAIGDGEDFNQALGDDQSQILDEAGYQAYDRRHSVVVSATTITPWGFRLGGTARWESGLPYSLLLQKESFDSVPPQYGNFGAGNPSVPRTVYETGQRNDQRNPSEYNFDVKLTKEMNLGRGMNLQLAAEIFNLLNDGTYRVWNPFSQSGQQINGNNVAIRRFGRNFQVSMKLAF